MKIDPIAILSLGASTSLRSTDCRPMFCLELSKQDNIGELFECDNLAA